MSSNPTQPQTQPQTPNQTQTLYKLRIVASKPKLRKLVEFATIDGEIETMWLRYTPSHIFQRQINDAQTIAVLAKYNRSFFTEYATSGEGSVKIPSTIDKVLNKYFKEVDSIEVAVGENSIVLKSRDEVYEGSLVEIDLPDISIEFTESEYGFVPNLKVQGVYGIDSEEWSIKADEVKISYGDTLKLTVALEEGGKYTRSVKVLDKRDVSTSGVVVVDGKMLKSVIDLFSGPLYLIITDGPVIFTQKTTDYTISYILAPKIVEEAV